ncbi:MAG: RhuM family protein [Eikenella sp.]|nr:RhuM family protein [Eikenella sp.]
MTTDNTLILYTTSDGLSQFVLRELGGQLWLTQAEMAELYQVRPQSITQHIKAIYQELEIDEAATCKEYLHVQTEGGREVKRQLKHYSLPMIIAVGYRVHSSRGTQFRQWATRTLGEYPQKGFVPDDERLKKPPAGIFAGYLKHMPRC